MKVWVTSTLNFSCRNVILSTTIQSAVIGIDTWFVCRIHQWATQTETAAILCCKRSSALIVFRRSFLTSSTNINFMNWKLSSTKPHAWFRSLASPWFTHEAVCLYIVNVFAHIVYLAFVLVVSYMDLGIALRYVLEALKKAYSSKMYFFGIAALDKFKSRRVIYNHLSVQHVVVACSDSFIQKAPDGFAGLRRLDAATRTWFNSFPLILRVKAACFHLTIKVLLHACVLTLICACPIFKANFSHYNFPNANLRNF